jgi:SSS family solute:Na+ symporter
MQLLDWILTVVPLLVVVAAGVYAQRFVVSVADFMSANRAAGRYLLCIAGGELQTGAVVFVAIFEVISHSGFTLAWWGWMTIPVGIIVRISGFVIYRYRETRAMTLAQFFEIRYSKSFRIFTGLLGFFAGILNFGIIPAIGARCLVYFLGLPETVSLFSHVVPTYMPLMALFLSITVFVAVSGGVITVIVVNCIEGIMSQVFYLIIIFSLLSMFSWHQISFALTDQPKGHSLMNPFDSSGIKDFNIWYILMGLVGGIYGTMAWQNASAYNSAAYSAHESRMGGILSNWRELGKGAVLTLLGVCAFTYLHHPDFRAGAAQVQAAVDRISDPQAQEQMASPIALAHLLPLGVKGIFCAILLMGVFGGDATHLHSWSSIFVQDFLVPLRRKPFGPRQHLWILRGAIVGVALFAFVFGCLFRQTEYIVMWWTVTTAIYVGGAGAAIIGGLYWKKGTAAGAWAGTLTGSILSVGGILLRQVYGDRFPLNGTQISFFAMLIAVAVYIVVSLLTNREDFNMERMLHRGAYAKIKKAIHEPTPAHHRISWGKLIGMDDDFTLGDKWVAGGLFGFSMLYFLVFLVGSVWNLLAPWPTSVWSTFWNYVGIGIPVILAVITGIWFTWGGLRDMRDLFRRLKQQRVNHLDDGTVVDHQNLDELIVKEQARGSHRHENLTKSDEP